MAAELKYDVYKWRGNVAERIASGLSDAEASRLVETEAPADVSWAVQEHGRCDVGRYIAVGAGDPEPRGK